MRQSIAAGVLRPSDLVEHALGLIEADNPRLHAWVVVDAAGARSQARQLEAALEAGRPLGPLAGVTLGVKDIFDVAGLPTRAGSKLTSAAPAAADAPAVTRLRAAGAIILGKAVTTEFACFDPPPTRNPLALDCSPGGSSSGSAAAVAAGHCLAALGSQTGGSIIRPAAYCGVLGFKPSFGAVSREGVVPVSQHLDHVGLLARSAADLAALWPVLADPGSGPNDGGGAGAEPRQGLPRFGLVESFLDEATSEVATVVRRAAAALANAGAQLVPVAAMDFERIRRLHRTVMACELARYHRGKYQPGKYGQALAGYGPALQALLAEGGEIDEAAYQAALAEQQPIARQVAAAMAQLDGWLMPAAPAAAPGADSTGDPRFNSPWSYMGMPAVTIPCGLAPSNGTGVGMQLVARHGQDCELLEHAAWCEQTLRVAG